MGYVIDKGFIFRSSNSSKVQKVNEQLKNILTKLVQEHVMENMMVKSCHIANIFANKKVTPEFSNKYFELLSRGNISLSLDPEKTIFLTKNKYSSSIFDAIKSQYILFTDHSLDCNEFNYSKTFIYFKTVGKNTLYYFQMNNDIVKKFIEINKELNILEPFSYVSGERPDEIKQKDWKYRERVWKQTLKGANCNNSMYGIEINPDFYFIREWEIAKYLPKEEERLVSIFKHLRRNELFHKKIEETGKDPKEIEMFEYSGMLMDVGEQLMEEVKNAYYLKDDTYISKMLKDEEILDLVFNVSFEAGCDK